MYVSPDVVTVDIPFNALVPGLTWQTLLAGPVTFKYKILKVTMQFADTALFNVRYYFFVSTNTNIQFAEPLPDENIFSRFTPQGYFTGNNCIREATANYKIPIDRSYIKFQVYNGNAGAVPVHATINIQSLLESE